MTTHRSRWSELHAVLAFALFTAIWLGLLAGRDAQALPLRSEVQESLADIFGAENYGYCHDKEFPLSHAERGYCPLVGSKSRACPKLPAVCQNENYPKLRFFELGEGHGQRYGDTGDGEGQGEGSQKWGDGTGDANGRAKDDGNGQGKDSKGDKNSDGSSKSESKSSKPSEPPPPPKEPIKLEVPKWLAMLAEALFYLLAAAVVGFIIYLIAKNLLKGRDKEDPEAAADESDPAQAVEEPIVRGPVETDVDRLLARARAAAARGDFKQAIDDTYAALLRRLEGDGHIDLHPSRTNGDYQRQLRSQAELRAQLRDIARDVERVHFGTETPSHPLFASIYQRVLPLVGRTVVLFLALWAAAGQLSCTTDARQAQDSEGPPSFTAPQALRAFGKPAPGSTGPLGWQAIADLLNRHGSDVTAKRDGRFDLEDGGRTVVLLPDAPVDPPMVKKLVNWTKQHGGQLLVFGHREDIGEELRVTFSLTQRSGPLRASDTAPYRLMGNELQLPSFGRLVDTSASGNVQPLVERGDALTSEIYGVLREYPGGGRIVMFADDAMFKNLALLAGDNAMFLLGLFEHMDQDNVEIWDGYTTLGGSGGGGSGGKGAQNPLESIQRSKLAPFIIHLLALVLLYLFMRGTRFGTPKEPKQQSRRAFADHARALGMGYARAKASRHALGLYAVWAIERLRERFSRGQKRGIIPLAESIAERTGQPVGHIMEILTEALGARDEVAPPSSFRPGGPVALDPSRQGPLRDRFIMQKLDEYLAQTHGKKPSSP